jgi:hypothetical protein
VGAGDGDGSGLKRLKVIVTRTREQVEPLASRIQALGHEVVRCPLIELEPIGPEEIEVAGYDRVVVTSPFGARELLRRARGELPLVAAIGPGTAAALREGGVEPALVPLVSTQEGLAAELAGSGGRTLFAGAESARRHLVDALGAEFVPLYRTHRLRPETPPASSCPPSRSGRRRLARRGPPAYGSSRKRKRMTSTGSLQPLREPRFRTAARAEPAQPPWSASTSSTP